MEPKEVETIPAEMEQVRQQFESWRNTHARRSRIPEALWTSAVKLARQHGLHGTAKALHLDYTKLKALVGGNSTAKRKEPSPAFLELVTADQLPECVMELENARGKKMRIHLRGVGMPDVALLSRIFWSSRS
jgi:hypothetical protein